MKPVNFKEANTLFTKPPSMTNEECRTLPAYKGDMQVISCWELSSEDLERLKQTRRIYLRLYAPVQVPVLLEIEDPFVNPTCERCLNECVTRFQINDVKFKYFCSEKCAVEWAKLKT